MALVNVDGMPMVAVGHANVLGVAAIANVFGSTLVDAVNEATIFIGQVFTEDGGTHTIDTTGSSSLGWRTGAVTFLSASTTVKVGLATVDAAVGPPARATNAANVITFGVSASLIGGGSGITATAWQEHVPDTGTKTIANGDLVAFAVQMTALGVGDLVNVSSFPAATGPILSRPCVTSYLAAAYANVNRLPNCVITFSDGVRGYFYGGFVAAADPLAQTWNNASAQREYGNLIQLPFPVKVYGVIAGLNATADVSFNLYSNPLVSPVAEKTVSIDLNQVGAVSALAVESILFPTPYLAAANQPLAIVATPTTVTSVTMYYKTFPLSLHQASESGSGYAVSRPASGGFTAQNANKDRYAIGLLIGAFDNGAGGGSIGYPASRSYNG